MTKLEPVAAADNVGLAGLGTGAAAGPAAGLIVNGPYNLTNAGNILENAIPGSAGVILNDGPGSFINTATISGADVGLELNDYSGANYLFNSGTILGDSALLADNGSGNLTFVNQGVVSGAIRVTGATGSTRVVNSGTINSGVFIDAARTTLVNSGAIHGAITFGSGGVRLVNTGTIEVAVTFSGDGNVFLGQNGAVPPVIIPQGYPFAGPLQLPGSIQITGSGANSRYYAGGAIEIFDFWKDGAAIAVGGSGRTYFDYEATFTNSMIVQGGSGSTEADLYGDYIGAKSIILGGGNFVGVNRIGLDAAYDYEFEIEAGIADSGPYLYEPELVGIGKTVIYDISPDLNHEYKIYGLPSNNVVKCAPGVMAFVDIDGAAKPNVILSLTQPATILATDWGSKVGLAVVRLAAGANDIQLSDALVQSAYNHTLTVKLKAGPETIDDSQVATTTNTIIANATLAIGDDTFIFGAAHDIVSLGASNSNSANYDTISNFDFANDSLRVQGFTPHAIDDSVFGSLSSASFDADLTSALAGHLHSSDALLFTANSGGLAGETFLVAATNGSDGYAAGDLVVKLTGSISGTLTTANV